MRRTSCSASRDVPHLLQCLKRCAASPAVLQEMRRTSCSASRDVPYLLQYLKRCAYFLPYLKRCAVLPSVPQEMCRTSCSASRDVPYLLQCATLHYVLYARHRQSVPSECAAAVPQSADGTLTDAYSRCCTTVLCSVCVYPYEPPLSCRQHGPETSRYLLLLLCPRQLPITDIAADRIMSLKYCHRRLSCQATFPMSTCPLPYVVYSVMRLQVHVLTSAVQFSCDVAAMCKCLQNCAALSLTSCELCCADAVYLRVLCDYCSE